MENDRKKIKGRVMKIMMTVTKKKKKKEKEKK